MNGAILSSLAFCFASLTFTAGTPLLAQSEAYFRASDAAFDYRIDARPELCSLVLINRTDRSGFNFSVGKTGALSTFTLFSQVDMAPERGDDMRLKIHGEDRTLERTASFGKSPDPGGVIYYYVNLSAIGADHTTPRYIRGFTLEYQGKQPGRFNIAFDGPAYLRSVSAFETCVSELPSHWTFSP
ncbi:MAG: hypothetical protein ABJ205_07850 [Erythrobacter sp.]|uniref:hypothetical protein n=1 Tax=Erythrobacter sp. TaxID=1042 RepID=UPI00326464AB